MVRQIELTESNSQKVEELSRQTGKTPDEVVNEMVGKLATADFSANQDRQDWKQAWKEAAGMWKDRDDIPELMAQLRKEMLAFQMP